MHEMEASSEEEVSDMEVASVQPWDSDDELDLRPGMPWWQAAFGFRSVGLPWRFKGQNLQA